MRMSEPVISICVKLTKVSPAEAEELGRILVQIKQRHAWNVDETELAIEFDSIKNFEEFQRLWEI